jgi:hypothetical protein
MRTFAFFLVFTAGYCLGVLHEVVREQRRRQ